jgi:hypothetical protein
MPMLRCKDDPETVQGLAHHYCPVIDNLSNLSEWLSDTLSRAVTGEGFTKRGLYTNDEDYLFAYKRVFILTGIGLVITKSDLLDRSIIIQLERIADGDRRDEQLLHDRFEAARPRLFGAILDLLAGGIREYHNVKPNQLPRMADFAKWSMAIALGQGRDPAAFVADFSSNVERQNDEALNASVVATVLLAFLADGDEWRGQPHELYSALKQQSESMRIAKNSFPGSAAALGRRLREVRPNLLALGWQIDFQDKARPRLIHITRFGRKNTVGVDNVERHQDSTVSTDGSFPLLSDPWEGEGGA